MSRALLLSELQARAAERLWNAQVTRTPCRPVRELIDAGDVVTAYGIATANIDRRLAAGARRIGRKIGLTSVAVQRQLGVDQPDFGALLDDMVVADGSTVSAAVLLQPKIEAEVAFVLGRDLDQELASTEQMASAVSHAVAALEIVDSRIEAWDITIADTVADNASSGLFVLGGREVLLADVSPIAVEMTMRVNDVEASSGSGIACLGDPLAALLWLARTARDLGDPLRAGEVVLSGALGPMVSVNPGDEVAAHISGLGSVQVRFAHKEDVDG